MNNGSVIRKLAIVVGIMFSSPLLAHHSAAAFDTGAEVTMKATVVEWKWAHPHCLLIFTTRDAGGTEQRWIAETSNPTDMGRRGWVREQLKPGDQITISLQPARNGSPVGRILRVVQADGKTLVAYGQVPLGGGNPPQRE